MTVRVAVADDHPVIRDGLVAMLETQPDLVVVGQAATGDAALDLLATTRPDVLLLDLEMPGLDGWGLLERLRAAPDDAAIPVLLVTAHAHGVSSDRLRAVGVAAMLAKPLDVRAFRAALDLARTTPVPPPGG